jgi:hypothetical protein
LTFLLKSSSFDEMFLPTGPGGMSVLFGRNGAGKSLSLGAIENALRGLRAMATASVPGTVEPTCTVLLHAGSQEDSPRLFSLLLAHLGWGPLSDLPTSARQASAGAIPAWSSHEARPPSAPGLTVAELADRPLADLRAAIVSGLAAWIPGGPSAHTRVLAEALASSATVAVSTDWQVGLAAKPGPADDELVQAARAYLDDVDNLNPEDADPSSLHHPLWLWARQLSGQAPGLPIVLLTTQLARPGQPRGLIHPGSGWPQLGDELAKAISGCVPRPVVLAPGRDVPQPADTAAETSVLGLLEDLLPDDRQPSGEYRHPFAVHPAHATVMAVMLQVVANAILPRFVADAGALILDIAPPGEWHRRRAKALFTGGLNGDVAVDDLPSGLRTWALAAISFAQAHLQAADWTGSSDGGELPWRSEGLVAKGDRWQSARGRAIADCDPPSLRPVLHPVPSLLYLLDEPEAHLHLTAQRDVVELAGNLAAASRGVVVATHSLAFLDAPSGRSQIVTLQASAGKIRSSACNGLRDLADHASMLGLPPSALALACRGVLMVEGPNDRQVIQRYGGIDLDKERVVIVVLQGHHGAAGIAELEFLHALRIPIFILLDHVRSEAIRQALAGGAGSLSAEERTVTALHHSLKERRLEATLLPFQHVDIIRAVPEAEITWALQQLSREPFIGWKRFDEHAEAEFTERRTKFKDTFRASTRASVEDVIRRLVTGNRTGNSPYLHGVLAHMLDDIDGSRAAAKLGAPRLP